MKIKRMLSKTAANPNFAISLILVAALGSTVFTLLAGTLIYRSTGRMIAAGTWVEHTQEVLTTLQMASQALDRVESNSLLYISTKEDERLQAARSGVLRLESSAIRVKDQTSDKPEQSANKDALLTCSAALTRDLNGERQLQSVPRDELFRCRQIVGSMSEQERKLLRERTEASQRESSLSLTTDLGFAGGSLAILSGLFAFLLRDAFARRRIAKQATQVNLELAASVQALREQAVESELLTSARNELQLCVRLEQLYACAARCVVSLVPGSSGGLAIINNSRNLVETMVRWDAGDTSCRLPDSFSPGSCCGFRSGGLRWRRKGASEIHCSHFMGAGKGSVEEGGAAPESYVCLPMMAHGETLGVLFLEISSEAIDGLAEKRLDGLREVIQLVGMSMASLQLRLKLEHQSIRDPLTGLFNRHVMNMTLDKEMARCKRKRTTMAVLMLDVDHFKSFNDRFGHTTGDTVLASVAAVLQTSVRTEDFVCRYGGEEFMIVLPEVSEAIALARGEKIRHAVANLQSDSSLLRAESITVSIGMVLYGGGSSNAGELIRKADEALYWAKSHGRDQVVMHRGPTESSLPSMELHLGTV